MDQVTIKKTPINRITGFIDSLSEHTGVVISFLIPVSVIVVLYEILARQLNIPQNFTIELGEFLFGATFVLGGAYALRYGAHVTVDLLWAKLSSRNRAILDLVTSLFFLFFVGVLIWKGWDAAFRAFLLGERTESAWAPIRWPIRMVIPVGAFLLLLQGIAKFIRDVQKAKGREASQ
ncbi:MAG: Tripartite ATP-independent periplasmic transporter DctQ component [Chloroflexi bacterium]|nr:Tripartite ATP-independent periplasmic transporter DctQ component [Chloroflexota bacterium]